MANKPIHTVHRNGKWINVQEGDDNPMSGGATKAMAGGRRQAMTDKVEHVIHNKDGKISGKNSYGNDPRRVKG
jgi:hypothetical protein